MSISGRPPSLGHLLVLLRNLCSHLTSTHTQMADMTGKLDSLDRMATADVAAFIRQEGGTETVRNQHFVLQMKTKKIFIQAMPTSADGLDRLGSSELRALAARTMRSVASDGRHRATLAAGAVESAALIILKHLEHYLLRGGGSDGAGGDGSFFQRTHRRLIGKEKLR